MKNIKLTQDENLSIRVGYQLLPSDHQKLDLYFSLPDEMGISAKTLTEEQYFHHSIQNHSAYYSDQLHVPLVRSRYISQKKGEQSDYRLNLNLYSYQIRTALDTDIKQTLKLKESKDFYPQAIELAEQTSGLLKKLRRYTPSDEKLRAYFENADNYLSWQVEQSFLKLLSRAPKSSEYSSERNFLFGLCRRENEYREENQYNSQTTLADPNRITNKMRLLQRLIEYGVVFQKKTKNLNSYLNRIVKGTVTAIIMAFVMVLVLNARTNFTEVTIALVGMLGVIYGLREIFKEDITRIIWRRIQKGLPKWRIMYSHSVNKSKVANQTIWLEYISNKDLPLKVDKLFQTRRQQNKQAAQLLHFRSETKVNAKSFLPGYDEIQQQIYFNLTPFIRFLRKGEGRLYALENNKITKQAVERRYQINVVLMHTDKQKQQHIQRFKITLNRSHIINIEAIEVRNSD
ncbi:hypothetical protein GMES_4429 [Paraglaciecola mesophila KMM 241]|uniref:Uncharacterized protein n=1 Tax=Paraglaciecola mesophila KMM 241 TaxID=1128912 RepID=K6ZTQ3_9ALTE|nr:hypothetical protein [Paraglaciecola mesophila]GAC26695.1 hypothetical protein GMES_4429 [Paraglaciecola mesophila KMM 241]